MRPHHTRLSLVASIAALLVGCGGEEPAGTPGQLGNLRFAYSVPGVCEGCGTDREVLAGSVVDLKVANVHHRVRYQVRSTAPDVVDFQLSPRCNYTLEADCAERVVVTTKHAGDADLEVFDDWTGTVFDRTTVKVREAASIETSVKETPASGGPERDVPAVDGVFQLKIDSDVEILSTPRAADGRELLAAKGALKHVYANEHVVGPRPVVVTIPTIEYARAIGAGLTTVALAGGDAHSELAFHVVR